MTLFKKYLALILVCISFVLKSQFSGYTFCDWDKITLQENYTPSEGDTCIVFASIRNYQEGKPEFFDYDLDTSGTIHYTNIYFNGNKWVCSPKSNLEKALEATKTNNDLVAYVEGMGKDFTANIDRATRFTRLYNVTTIMFDWPTFRPYMSGGKNYKTARVESKRISKSLVSFFKELNALKQQNRTGSGKLSLILHSLGNRLIKEAVINDYLDLKTKLFNNIILNAACVKMRFHKKWVEKLNIQENVYITSNNHDRTLNLARLAGCSKRLGMHTRWRKADNATYLNFSKILTVEHNYFLMKNVLAAHPGLKEMYYDIFHGKKLTFEDEKKYRIRKEGKVIDLIKPVAGDISIGINFSM